LQVHKLASMQVCNFATLQINKFTKSTNYKLIIIKFNLTNCNCTFASLQIYKIKESKKLQIANYNFTTLQIPNAHFEVHKFATSQNYKI
jgi:hypothetical protein